MNSDRKAGDEKIKKNLPLFQETGAKTIHL